MPVWHTVEENPADPDELAVLNRCLALIKAEASAKSAESRTGSVGLSGIKHYPTLDEAAIKNAGSAG